MSIQKTHKASLKRPDFRSAVDIIIPFHGQYDKVTRLIESIFRYTYSSVYNLCLVDDCSPNIDFVKDLSGTKMTPPLTLQCVRCQEHQGFAGALQKGFDQTKNPWILFLNSDCLVEDVNWLQSLGEAALAMKSDNVRMVAPRTNNPVGGDERQKGEKGKKCENIILTEGHLSMYAFMVHRDLFGKVGGFLKHYPYGGYEDEEFAYRMRHYGFKQGIAGSSWVHHDGGSTIREMCQKNPDLPAEIDKNFDLCVRDIRSLGKSTVRH
jgi:GT2 family glycosyltransferase